MACRIKLILPVNETTGESTRPFFDWSISPSSPTNIRLVSSGVGDTEEEALATIAWDSVSDATSYNVYRGEVAVDVGDVTEYSLSGLLPNVVEHLAVSAVNDGGESEPSYFDILVEIGDFDGSEDALAAPTNLSVVAGIGRSAVLSWDAPTSFTPLQYPIFKQTSNSFGLARVGEVDVAIESYEYDGLTSNTTYTFGVSALYEYGESVPVTISYTTGDLGEAGITNFRIESFDLISEEIVLAWDALAGAVNYEISAPELDDLSRNISDTSITIQMRSGKKVTFYLVAIMSDETRSAQVSLEAIANPAVVYDFRAEDITSTSFTLFWQDQGEGVEYRLWMNCLIMKK